MSDRWQNVLLVSIWPREKFSRVQAAPVKKKLPNRVDDHNRSTSVIENFALACDWHGGYKRITGVTA